MELEEAISKLKYELDKSKIVKKYQSKPEELFDDLDEYIKSIETVLNHLTKQEKMIENAKDRIEYYLIGNSTLNDYSVRDKELERLLKILNKAEESE